MLNKQVLPGWSLIVCLDVGFFSLIDLNKKHFVNQAV